MAPFAKSVLLLLLVAAQHVAADDWAKGREGSKAVSRKHAEHHWRSARQRQQSLQLDGKSLGDFLRHTMQHQYTLPMEQVQKSLVYLGSNFRLRKVVHDLILAKRPIKVGAIGGSITNGAKASKVGETDWFSLVGKYMRTAFPKANITTRNGALPATPSALMNMCLEQYVDDDVDLVFVEYVANDGTDRFDEIKPKVYERLLRKLLNKPNKPAVVLLQLMPKGMAYAPATPQKAHFYATLEDTYGTQAQYYDLVWLSFRNAMWRLSELHTYGYNFTDFMWDVDFMHPIDPGMAAISDMVAYLLQQTALSLLLNPLSRTDRTLLQERLPDPMFKGNWEGRNLMCTYGEAFKPLADESASSGWEFLDEGKPGAPKWGYISRQPGSTLKIRVNSMRASQEAGGAGGDSSSGSSGHDSDSSGSKQNEPMNVMLAYLKSYEGMGMASFECTSGCTCEPRSDVDALHALRQSTIYLVRLLVSQSEECEISVTVSDRTRSNGHKFKVSGIMMDEYTGADVTEKLHEEQWLSQLQQTAHEGSDRAVGSSSHADDADDSSTVDSGSSSSSSSNAPAAAPAGSEAELKAAAKDSLASGGQGTFVAAGSAQQETAKVAAANRAGSNDRRLQQQQQQRRPPRLLRGIARRLRQLGQHLHQAPPARSQQ